MSASVEASHLIQSIAGPVPAGTKVKALIHRAARLLGWSDSRAFDVWYAKARRIDAEEMDRLREVAGRRTEVADSDDAEFRAFAIRVEASIGELKAELARLNQRLARETSSP